MATGHTQLLRACGWIDRHLDAFAVRSADGPQMVAELKAVGELAHAADFLIRASAKDANEIGDRWMRHCLDTTRRGDSVRELIVKDRRYLLAATTYVPCHLAGHVNAALVATVGESLANADMPLFFWQLFIPTLLMLGILPPPGRRDEAWRRGVLGNRPAGIVTMPADAIYLLTHECFWASHWGHITPQYGNLIVSYVAEMLPVLVAHYTSRGHADLLSELILATHTQGLSCPATAAWEVLATAQSDAGNVVPPEDPGTEYPRLAHSILPRTYHTTLVAIMAWAACQH